MSSPTTKTRWGVALAAAATLATAGSAAAVGGPVVLGGDNFPRNGDLDTVTGNARTGWLAMQRALAWVAPRVGRFNDNSVAAIGARQSTALTDDAGAAIGVAAGKLAMPVTYLNGAEAIAIYFEEIRTGKATPKVLWLAGTGASNGLDAAELGAVVANAPTIAQYLAGGGGLIAHGDETVYAGWLPAVAPGLEAYLSGGNGLALTPSGLGVLPGLGNPDISVGSWRSAFRGTLGDLDIVANATNRFEADSVTPQKVVLAGGTAWTGLAPADLRVTTTVPVVVDRGDVVPYRIEVTNDGPNLAGNVVVTHQLPIGWAFGGAATGAGSCVTGTPVTCQLRPIGVGKTAAITIFGKALRAGALNAVTRTTSAAPDAAPSDNTDVNTTTTRLTTLRVKVGSTAAAGRTRVVRIAVRNTGKRVAKNVILRSPIPRGFSLSRRPAGGRVEGNAAIWELGSIRPGRTRVVVFRLGVDRGTRGLRCIPGHARAANANFTSARACRPV